MPERGAEMLSNVWNDIRYTLRTLTRNPGFAIAAIVPIALGIGINTGIFSVLNSVAWRPLPVPEPQDVVSIYQEFRGGPRRTVSGARTLFSLPEYRAYRDEAQSLSGLMAYSRRWTVTLGRESPREIEGILVTCNYFDVLDMPPAMGTGFTPTNCGSPNNAPAIVLSHAFWKDALGGDPQILQKPIVLNGQEVAVVGVTPVGFDGVDMARDAFFAPTLMATLFREGTLEENPHVSWLTLIGRRRTDTTLAQVRANLSLVAKRIDQQQPGRTTTLIVEPATALSLPGARRNILQGATLIMSAFGLVLLIAAANVANILLARATARAREIAIRLSVGATRARLVQQLLTESLIIALAGALCGSLIFWWSFEGLIVLLLSSVPGGEAFRLDATPDITVLWFALGLTAATALAFGLVPALHASRGNVHALTKEDSGGSTGGHGWMRGTLIGAQFALCTMLLIPAGLLTRAVYATHTFDPRFDYDNVAVVSIDLRDARYENGNASIFHDQWLERVSALPGVEQLATASRMPLSAGRSQTSFRVANDAADQSFDVNTVSPEFFALLDIPIVRGRLFTDSEANAALVTESTARRYWPGQDAVGQMLTSGTHRWQIVGIVRDAQMTHDPSATSSYVYLPAIKGSEQRISVLARTPVDLSGFAAAVRAETLRMDASLVVHVQPLSANVGLLQTLSQVTASVAGALGLLALSLAAIGIYGVVAYVVSRRRREVGVRMALGAEPRDVQRLILRQTLRPVAIGLTIGVVGAAAIVRLLQAVLFGVSPFDPIAFIGAPVLMLGIAVTAAFLPTRRAMHVNPMRVLRSE